MKIVTRQNYAKEQSHQPQEFWKSVIFTEKYKFEVFSIRNHQKVWRKKNCSGENPLCLWWWFMSASGVGKLVF